MGELAKEAALGVQPLFTQRQVRGSGDLGPGDHGQRPAMMFVPSVSFSVLRRLSQW